MANKKKEALGKGIRALLENMDHADATATAKSSSGSSQNGIAMIDLNNIEVNPYQPRAAFDKETLEELAQSITVHGVIQPITVRKVGSKFQIIAGERRTRASKIAGLSEIPAYIRTANDQEMLEIGLIENIQREDLNALEIAISYKRLIDECDLNQEEMGGRVGKKRSTVTNYLRLLKLPPDIQIGIKDRSVSMGHARALVSVEDTSTQLAIYNQIKGKRLSVRDTEQLVKEYNDAPTKSKKKVNKSEELPSTYKKVQRDLTSKLSTKVALKNNKSGSGQIVISYFSDDDLTRILEILDI